MKTICCTLIRLGAQINNVLCSLPEDWDVLYLNACMHQVGDFVAPGVRVFKKGACTLGYIARLNFAIYHINRGLSEGNAKQARHMLVEPSHAVDHILSQPIVQGKLRAFIADPPLAHSWGTKANSLIAG